MAGQVLMFLVAFGWKCSTFSFFFDFRSLFGRKRGKHCNKRRNRVEIESKFRFSSSKIQILSRCAEPANHPHPPNWIGFGARRAAFGQAPWERHPPLPAGPLNHPLEAYRDVAAGPRCRCSFEDGFVVEVFAAVVIIQRQPDAFDAVRTSGAEMTEKVHDGPGVYAVCTELEHEAPRLLKEVRGDAFEVHLASESMQGWLCAQRAIVGDQEAACAPLPLVY